MVRQAADVGDLRAVADVLGHSPDMLMRVYAEPVSVVGKPIATLPLVQELGQRVGLHPRLGQDMGGLRGGRNPKHEAAVPAHILDRSSQHGRLARPGRPHHHHHQPIPAGGRRRQPRSLDAAR
jgi:hypothetical protein